MQGLFLWFFVILKKKPLIEGQTSVSKSCKVDTAVFVGVAMCLRGDAVGVSDERDVSRIIGIHTQDTNIAAVCAGNNGSDRAVDVTSAVVDRYIISD